jgi:sorbitol-specific phosphotransferase system component IIBC
MDTEKTKPKVAGMFGAGALAAFVIGGTIGVSGYGGAVALVVAGASLYAYAKLLGKAFWPYE